MGAWHKRVELLANVAIIVVTILLGGVLVRRYLMPASPKPAAVERAQIKPGTKLALPDMDWGRSDRTLLLALSTSCHFCTESAPFYQRLIRDRGGRPVKLVAVFPQRADDGRQYLSRLGVSVDEVQQLQPGSIDVAGTPTLILVDSQGRVQNVWVGKLDEVKEAEVLNSL